MYKHFASVCLLILSVFGCICLCVLGLFCMNGCVWFVFCLSCLCTKHAVRCASCSGHYNVYIHSQPFTLDSLCTSTWNQQSHDDRDTAVGRTRYEEVVFCIWLLSADHVSTWILCFNTSWSMDIQIVIACSVQHHELSNGFYLTRTVTTDVTQ